MDLFDRVSKNIPMKEVVSGKSPILNEVENDMISE